MPFTKEQVTPQWLAGFFDGEGCVCARPQNELRRNWCLTVHISQKDLFIISLIHSMFGGRINTRADGVSVVYWSGRSCLRILSYIKDFSVIKKNQIDWGIQMASSYDFLGHSGPVRKSAEIIEERERLGTLITKDKTENSWSRKEVN